MKARSWLGILVAAIVPIVLFFGIRSAEAFDYSFVTPSGHFYVVSAVSLLAFIISITIGIAGNRLRNVKVTFMSLAFISLAGLFMIHGLSTPNLLIHASHLPGFSAQLSVLLASLFLWVSSIDSDNAFMHFFSRWRFALIPIWLLLLIVFGILGMMFPHSADFIPLDSNFAGAVLSSVVLLLNLSTSIRYYQSYRYFRFPSQISVVYSCILLVNSQMIMVIGDAWKVSWWLYHFLLLAATVIMLVGLFRQYASNHSLTLTIRGIFESDPLEQISVNLSPGVRALVQETEARDTYTAGHNIRVSFYALRLAEEMQLSDEMMRAIAQGAAVHDIGKMDIPDYILNKQDELTDEERAIIQKHPVTGYDMCRKLGFMREELQIIRSHHERWDGKGYPDKLSGEQIPLLARIVAVADVYDALTSNRSYRSSWSNAQANALIAEGSGSHFDPVVAEAWQRLCSRDPKVVQYPDQVKGIYESASL